MNSILQLHMYKLCTIFSAQYWHLTNESTMENKCGKWMYQTKSWNLPEVNTADFIEDKATHQVHQNFKILFKF